MARLLPQPPAGRCPQAAHGVLQACLPRQLLVLAHLRKDETLDQVAAGFGVSTATAGRYVTETVEILVERAPSLHEALRELPPEGFVILRKSRCSTNRIGRTVAAVHTIETAWRSG